MTVLSVNLNKVALLRNQRDIGYPSVTEFAQTCIDAGAGGITVHPRPDCRHIRPSDVTELAKMLTVEFNIEGNPFAEAEEGYPGFLEIVREIEPAQCTLVPDEPDQKTSDHGWDLATDGEWVKTIVEELQALGIRVSLFLDPDVEHVALAAQTGADRIELYTEAFATAHQAGDWADAFATYSAAAARATELGLGINAGHDLNLDNLADFCQIPGILEVSIGHAITADALKYGFAEAVRKYNAALSG